MYDIMEIANWFLHKEPMTHKKLQKLCYYAYAWFYTLKDVEIFDEPFEAWVHGPVSNSLYQAYKCHGWEKIDFEGPQPKIVDEDIELLESVWETYGDQTGNSLEALSHSEPPWIEARRGLEEFERGNHYINLKTIKEYYSSIYDGDDA
ncbi:SocA family protein [Clostridia bacterium]|nr:SocA family protein [Clostridia bacterium]